MLTYIFSHKIDWSLLTDGFTIWKGMHQIVYSSLGKVLNHGDSTMIKIIVEGEEFEVKLTNINFSKQQYPDHDDILQIRYSKNSAFALKLQSIFAEDFYFLLEAKKYAEPRKSISLPNDKMDEVILFATQNPGVFTLECVKNSDIDQAKNDISQLNELDFETQLELREDKNASIKEVIGIKKVRMIDRSIGESLKKVYDYRCQMTGKKIGDQYGICIVEAHHIEPFTKSLNNDMSNIIILSPNYHRIIHKANPIFDKKQKAFVYPNGLIEKVLLNKHL